MKLLVACEESQRVSLAFREFGHLAFSCDLKDCSGGHPEWHIKGDCREVIEHNSWDLIIAHPPCTYLSRVSAVNLVDSAGNIKDYQRYEKMLEAVDFFMYFYNLTGIRVCIENPIPMKRCNLPPYSQVIQPYDFGDMYSKKTLLWLNDLPYLIPEYIVYNRRQGLSECKQWCLCHSDSVNRSKTFTGIAQAMAKQWGNL